MSDSSTRARPAATAVAKVDTTVTARPPRAEAASRPACEALPPYWLEPSITAHNAIRDLLNDAHAADLDEDDRCTDALRVLRIVTDLADQATVDGSTKQDSIADAAFDTIALLEATLAYPGQTFGSERQRAIRSALTILNAVVDVNFSGPEGEFLVPKLLTAIAAKDAALPKQPLVPTNPSNFRKGRDLAIQMLAAGDALDQTDEAEPYRWMRGGAAQNRFVLPFLHQLLAQPELVDGFAAVLSGRLGTGDTVRADSFALDWAEYEAGEVGADGTAAGDEAAGHDPHALDDEIAHLDRGGDVAGRTAADHSDENGDAKERRSLAHDANQQITQLAGGLKDLLKLEQPEKYLLYHGMLSRIEALTEIVFFAGGICIPDPLQDPDLLSMQRTFEGLSA